MKSSKANPRPTRSGLVVMARVELRNTDSVTHDWSVAGIPGAHVAAAANGVAQTAFQAPAPGRYAIICTVSGHEDAGMLGTLIVQ